MSLKRSRKANRPPNRPARIPRSSRGVALIAVLWVVLLLSVIAGSLAMLTRTELGLSRNLVLSAKAETLAEGGIHLAIDELLNSDATAKLRADGSVWQVELEAGRLDVSIIDVTGRIDLNIAPPELMVGLFEAAGAESELAEIMADRIIDWRDADEMSRPNGGEQDDYAGYEPPVRVANNPFLAADEIMRVPGMSADLWGRIADAVTVHSRRPGVNPLYASKIALLALPGMDEAMAEAIVSARIGPDAESTGRQAQRIAEIANLAPPEARRYLTGGSSNIYAIRARAELPEGAVYILEAVIEPAPANDPPWRAHEWRPGNPYADAGDPDEEQ
jgi:general secretion pathway protein K